MKTQYKNIQTAVPRLAAAALISLSVACGGSSGASYVSSQDVWSDLTNEQRDEIRAIMVNFQGGSAGIRSINVTSITGVLVTEATRIFSDPTLPANASLVISSQQLDLMDSEVLPAEDAAGVVDPAGAHNPYQEIVHDSANEITRDETVQKPNREFNSGSLSDFSSANTIDSPRDFFYATTFTQALSIGDAMGYQTASWQQQPKTSTDNMTSITSGETYDYQSQATSLISLEAGSTYDANTITEDEILSQTGWETASTINQNWGLTGEYTLYRPVLVDPNTAGECLVSPCTDPKVSGNTTTTTTTSVTPPPNPTPLPVAVAGYPELEVLQIVTNTRKTVIDTTGGNNTTTVTDHITTTTVYTVVDAVAERRRHSLERHQDSTETTRRTTTDVISTSGTQTTSTNTVESLRYTDDPVTRNNIDVWRSTVRKTITVTDSGAGTSITTNEGTTWLTDKIEVDPDVSAVPFSISGSLTTINENSTTLFGDNKAGVETVSVTTQDVNVTYGWAGAEISVSGTQTRRGSSITPPQGAPHIIQGDWDGTLSVTVGGESFSVSAEEWAAAVQP